MLEGHFSREIEAIRIDVFMKATNTISLCMISRNAEGISLRIIRAGPLRYAIRYVSGKSNDRSVRFFGFPGMTRNDEISPNKIHRYEILRVAYDYG
jgi:hypothetical protein